MPGAGNAFPFTSHHSSKTCLQSALNVAQSFNDLPYTNPSGQQGELPCRLSPTSIIPAPRMMPSFACCAMQCAYALLMVRNRTTAAYAGDGSQAPLVASLLGVLRQGLESITATLENYSLASEALGGMRGECRVFWRNSSQAQNPSSPRYIVCLNLELTCVFALDQVRNAAELPVPFEACA